MTCLVSRVWRPLMLLTTSYTQVFPTATGNGTDPAATEEPELAVGVAAPLVVPAGFEADPAELEAAPARLCDAATDVPAAEPHPASAITAAPARTARADLYLLMLTPRSVVVTFPVVPRAVRVGEAPVKARSINAI